MTNTISEIPPFYHKTKPYNHQRRILDSTWDKEYYALFWEMGLGKSKTMVDTAQRLFAAGLITGVVIVAEKGYYMNWPKNEFPKHYPHKFKYFAWDANRPVRVSQQLGKSEQRKALDKVSIDPIDCLEVFVINTEAFSSWTKMRNEHIGTGIRHYAEEFIKRHKGNVLFILDESTSVKNPRSKRSKALSVFSKLCKYRRILTGTPMTQSPLDIFMQFRILTKDPVLGANTFGAFRNIFAVLEKRQFGARAFQQVVGYKNLDDLSSRIKEHASRLRKEQCLDLPKKIYSTICVGPTKEQVRILTDLKQELIASIEEETLTAENALAFLTKALQIANGHAITDILRRKKRIPTNKPETLKAILSKIDPGEKVLIWGHFQEDLVIIKETLAEIDYRNFIISSDYKQQERDSFIDTWRKIKGGAALVSTPRVMGKSYTLVEACHVIYYSNGFSLENRLQSEDRVHRIGQDNDVKYFDIACADTPDIKVLTALKAKKNLQASILERVEELFQA